MFPFLQGPVDAQSQWPGQRGVNGQWQTAAGPSLSSSPYAQLASVHFCVRIHPPVAVRQEPEAVEHLFY